MLRRVAIAVLVCIAGASSEFAQVDPSTLPARDAHEGLLVAADPLQDAARYKARFGKKTPYDAGIAAIEVFFRNDNVRSIRVDLQSIRLILAPPGLERQRLGPLAVEDVVHRILNKGGPNPTVPRRPFPGRGPKKGRGKEWNELEATLRAAAMEMDVLPPQSSVRGFLFFDVNHRYDWLAHTRLYLPDLRFLPENKPLLFFEVDLAPARPR